MNDTVRLLQSHRSERSYKSDPIPDEILDNIIESAHLAPTSMNSQQVSIVVVKDAAHRKLLRSETLLLPHGLTALHVFSLIARPDCPDLAEAPLGALIGPPGASIL